MASIPVHLGQHFMHFFHCFSQCITELDVLLLLHCTFTFTLPLPQWVCPFSHVYSKLDGASRHVSRWPCAKPYGMAMHLAHVGIEILDHSLNLLDIPRKLLGWMNKNTLRNVFCRNNSAQSLVCWEELVVGQPRYTRCNSGWNNPSAVGRTTQH